MPLFAAALALLACSGAAPDADSAEPDDADAEEGHPLVPDAYADIWDVDSTGCEDATAYWAFTGSIDASGRLAGEETWYWFFAEEGWEDDCTDTFVLEAVEEPTPIEDDACNSCDRDFTASYVLDEDRRDCPFEGYEALLDNDDSDRIDEEAYTLALMLDTDPLGGAAGSVEVWTYVQDDASADAWNDRGISSGTISPETAGDYAGAAEIVWARPNGLCVGIEEG